MTIQSTTSRPAFDVQSVINRVGKFRANANATATAVASGRLDPATKVTLSDGAKTFQSNRSVAESLSFEKSLKSSGAAAADALAARKSFYGAPSAATPASQNADYQRAVAFVREDEARRAADGLTTNERNRRAVEASIPAARESGKLLSAESRALGKVLFANQGPGFSAEDVKSAVGKYEASQRFAANIDRFSGNNTRQRDLLTKFNDRIGGAAKTTLEGYSDVVTSFQASGRGANVAEQAKALGLKP
jgi:hypothetical protein